MQSIKARPKADRAIQAFSGHSHNGKNGADPPKGKAPCYRRSSKSLPRVTASYAVDAEKQALPDLSGFARALDTILELRSRGVMCAVWAMAGSNDRYSDGKFFVAPKAALLNKDLGAAAFRILCYALAKGSDWRFRPWQIRRDLGFGRTAFDRAMKELKTAGYACREFRRGKGGKIKGSGWIIIREPDQNGPPTDCYVNRQSVNVTIEEGTSSKKDSVQEHSKSGVNRQSESTGEDPQAFASLNLSRRQKEIIEDFNTVFVPLGARRVTRYTPALRKVLTRMRLKDRSLYDQFKAKALADVEQWRTKRFGLVALWHTYKPWAGKSKSAFAGKTIEQLKRLASDLREESNKLFRQDPKGTRAQRAEINDQIKAIDQELARKTGRPADTFGMERAVARSERENQAIKSNVIALDLPRNEDGFVVIGGDG